VSEGHDPRDMQAYEAKVMRSQYVFGAGITGTGMSLPCPGCASPDWLKHTLLGIDEAYAKGATCKTCGRGFRIIITRPGDGSTRLETVQTAGDELPAYLPPMRREEPVTDGA